MSSFQTPETTTPRRRRRLLPLVSLGVAGLFLATACASGQDDTPEPHEDAASASQSAAPERAAVGEGQGEPDALEGLSFSEGEDGAPSVEVDGELATDQPTTRVLTAGEGDQVKEGDVLKMSIAVVDPASGDVLAENFTGDPESVPVDQQLKSMNPEMHDLLVRNGVGSVVAAYSPEREVPAPPADGASPSASPSTQTQPAQLFVYKIESILPTQAQGEEVTERDERLPEVTVQDGRPVIATPEGEAPETLVVQPLIQGEGREVAAEDAVTVHYTGVTWSDGSTFDSSWESGSPFTFSPSRPVIEGWMTGLEGQRVGSRVLLSIPSEQAYGEQGTPTGDLKNEDLLFVVDILDAQAPAPQN
ncbi:FKBP-type peptidyl-prolyl cis-trans isomerase [Micrococcus endophyticus]|uniref:FKBP-type peptidyl-prolyl cis-trans isomerase n=1 Tax=Micrococcus endophyticus TaxID=455343 RepID=UPI0037FDE402